MIPRLAINFCEARSDKPRGGAAQKAQLQCESQAAPGIQIGDDEARNAEDLQHAVEVNGLRELSEQAFGCVQCIHGRSLSGRGASKIIGISSSSAAAARLP